MSSIKPYLHSEHLLTAKFHYAVKAWYPDIPRYTHILKTCVGEIIKIFLSMKLFEQDAFLKKPLLHSETILTVQLGWCPKVSKQ